MIGLVGSHRVGKTTLAAHVAERYGIPFVQTDTTGVFEKNGFDPKVDYDFETRLHIQRLIFDHFEEIYSAGGHNFVTDRTPIDLLTYTFADVRRQTVGDDLGEAFEKYVDDCYTLANRHLSLLVLIQPGIPIEETPGKAPSNRPYMEHFNALARGLLLDRRLKSQVMSISRDMLNLDKRIVAVSKAVEHTYDKIVNSHNGLFH